MRFGVAVLIIVGLLIRTATPNGHERERRAVRKQPLHLAGNGTITRWVLPTALIAGDRFRAGDFRSGEYAETCVLSTGGLPSIL